MEPDASFQFVAEAVLGALCLVGYRVEARRARSIASSGVSEVPIVSARVVGDGEWIVIGSSEEESFEAMSATPKLRSSGFTLEIAGNRVVIPTGTTVDIRAIEGARRAPLDAMTTAQGLKTRFTFEVRPGTLLHTDAADPQLDPYRSHEAKPKSIVLAGDRASAARKPAAFPGCWIMILMSGILGAVIASLAGAHLAAWVFLAAAALLMIIGYTALPPSPKPS